MRFDILTLFPPIIERYSSQSILGRAQKAGVIKVAAYNFREYTRDKHGHVDDRPYGGGPGMILQIQPIFDCLRAIGAVYPCVSSREAKRHGDSLQLKKGIVPMFEHRGSRLAVGTTSGRVLGLPRNDTLKKTKIVILDPAGEKFDQKMAKRFAKLDRLVLISGRYEGFDERVYKLANEKVSVGDYVLAGGELPALIIVETVARLLPGVLGNPESLEEETFNKSQIPMANGQSNPKSQISKLKIVNCGLENFVEYPQYTRPEEFMGWKVPKILLSGDHEKIREWREKRAKQ